MEYPDWRKEAVGAKGAGNGGYGDVDRFEPDARPRAFVQLRDTRIARFMREQIVHGVADHLAVERQKGALGVLDALSGEHLRDIDETGLSGMLLVVP